MISLDVEGNFRARCGVETTAPSELREGRPNNILYEVWASTMRYQIGIVLVCLPSPKVV